MIDIDELRTAVEAAGLNAISRDEVLELIDRLEAAEKERDALRAAQQLALEVLENVRGNINPERGYADELEADVERAIAIALPGAQPAPENCPCCGEPMRVYSRCSNSDCEAVTVTPEQARYNKTLAFERTVATRMEDQTAPSVTEWVQADTSLPTKYLGMHRADVLKDMISELEERCAILADALRSTAQTLAWVEHGECRGFSDDLLTTNEALDKARAALEESK